MKRLITIILVSIFILNISPIGGLAQAQDRVWVQSPSTPTSGSFSFYGVYDRVVGTESLDEGGIYHAVLSGDGQKLALSNYHFVYTVDADGSNLTTYPEPALSWGVHTLTIDQDGSRVFFAAAVQTPSGSPHHLYKIENDTITDILNVADYAEIATVNQIQATADGEYVYFLDDDANDNDVWRVAHNGGTPTKVIEDTDVTNNGYPGAQVKEFAISADASRIAFVLYGYWDGSYHSQEELFVKDAGGYSQLTTGETGAKGDVAISGDGNLIVYAENDDARRYSVHPDGSHKIDLEPLGNNVADPKLTYDGALMFYNDTSANGGRLTHTNGSGRLDLIPGSPIKLWVTSSPTISDNGSRVAFIYNEGTSQYGVYLGYLNQMAAVLDAPTIHNIAFDPAVMLRGDPNARVVLSSQISDPQGLGDIENIRTGQLLDGVIASGYSDCPAYFNANANDNGTAPDETAGDGIYSSLGQPGSQIDTLDQVTIRMGAQDASKKVVVADTILFVGNPGQMPLLPPTNLQAHPGVESIELTWDPSPSPDLIGYNVYRATSINGPWSMINPTPVTGDNYLDVASLTAGTTYYYYLTAVDAATIQLLSPNSESGPSNIAFATFGQLKLFIPDSYGANGANVTLPVNIANANGLEMCGVDIYVVYDPAVLDATEVQKTALTAGYTWTQNISTPGVVRAIIAATEGETLYGQGTLFNVLFDVSGSSGDTSDLAFQVGGTFFYDCDDLVNPVPLDLSDVGVFTVQAGYILGDLDGDGVVTSADVDLALDIAVGNLIPTPQQEAAGDLNGDGRINSADVVLIMRLVAGLPLFPTATQLKLLSANQVSAVGISAPTDSTLQVNGSTWVALEISDAANLAGADLVLNYDPFVATVTGVRTTSLSADFDIEFEILVAGQAKISLKPKTGFEDGLTSGSGTLLEVQFSATEDAVAGDTSLLTLAAVRLNDRYGRDFATSALQVQVNSTPGLLTVMEGGIIYLPTLMR